MMQETLNSNSSNERISDLDTGYSYESNSKAGNNVSLCSQLRSTRYRLAFMGFLGFVLVYSTRINLSVALVDMVEDSDDNSSETNDNCPVTDSLNDSTDNSGTFDWSTTQQANILGAFYYGYMLTMIPFGVLASKIGGKLLFGFGILVSGLLTFLTPPVSYLGADWLIVLRVVEGLVEASTYPSFNHLMGEWVPQMERSTFSAFASSGATVGNAVTQPIVGYLCTFSLWNGWPLGFYANGAVIVVWFVAWILIVSDTPKTHPTISEAERDFILANTVTKHRRQKIPWVEIVTSRAFYGILVCHFCSNFINYGIMSCLPQYLSDVLNFDISSNGFLSSLPWISCWIGALVFSNITDHVREQNWFSITTIRKTNQLIGTLTPGLFLILAGYAGCDSTRAVAFITAAMFFYGSVFSGFFCTNLDMAPNFAGVLMAVTNTFATIPGFVAPVVVDRITKSDVHSIVLWRTVFFVFAGVGWFGGLVFCLLGSAELQPWAIESYPADIRAFVSDGVHTVNDSSEVESEEYE